MKEDIVYSRPIATASKLGNAAPGRNLFIGKQVLLTGESATLKTTNGHECFLDSLLLLLRICKNISVTVPAGFDNLLEECRLIGNRVSLGGSIQFIREPHDYSCYDAILCIGAKANPDLPWTVINSNGWVARVSSGASGLCPDSEQENPIAALAAACLGVTEVFKRLLQVKESRGSLVDGLTFSLYSYSVSDISLGPSLPAHLPLDLLLVGMGAIGNGIVHLLSSLPIEGRIYIVDPQIFQPENLGTCLLIGPAEVGKAKATVAEGILQGRMDVTGFVEEIETFEKRLGIQIAFPTLVVNALDNIRARHAVQSLWPDLVIDGAIGDLACQVSCHPWGEDTACLKCLFQENGQSAEKLVVRATGLSQRRTGQPFGVVTGDDVSAAPDEKKEFLRARIGRQICSVIAEAVVAEVSEKDSSGGFEPSVPFVACLSACMVVAELVKYVSDSSAPLVSRFQFDALRGPAFGQEFPQRRRNDCVCVTRRRNIDTVRSRRADKMTHSLQIAGFKKPSF